MAQRAQADIDLQAVKENCSLLTDKLAGSALCAVVKADGYGHGATQVANAALAGGAQCLAVVSAQEADDLRADAIVAPLLVMGALTPEETELTLKAEAELVAWTPQFLDRLEGLAGQLNVAPRVHIKLDSGMGRLGEPDPAVALRLAERVARSEQLELVGVMTHFATADEPNSEFFEEQLSRFKTFAAEAKQRWPEVTAHAANSAALLREKNAHFDMARCGIAIYGLDPFGQTPTTHQLRPALKLTSYVAQVKEIAPGGSVGYGRRFIAREPTEIAVLPIGYGDGVRRSLTNNFEVLIGGRRYPSIGTISMDNITVDLGLNSGVQVGDEVVLIGEQSEERVLAEEWAQKLDTINYEITCGISPRVPRVYGVHE